MKIKEKYISYKCKTFICTANFNFSYLLRIFFPHLKREEKNKIPIVESFDDIHEKLINAYKDIGVKIPDVCKEYVSLMNDDVFDIFEIFDKLYDDFKNLKQKKGDKCNYVEKCAKKYEELSEIDKKEYKNIVQEEIDNFKLIFHEYFSNEGTCKITNELMNYYLMKPSENAIKAEALLGDTASPVTWTNAGIIFIAIIIFIFMVHKVKNKFN
ncbi:variable surface protein [Plasmodium gonderi]|uniref:Variable surface protein n=1 Tax=Plasmodium gonderi TaxID=77519 RepID=A0A1Y1JPC3_PLAGO|nr:variable surface protein [Plasmodium gonderi]GAW84289.1 variable surface protein [Plasmodium gonderi]